MKETELRKHATCDLCRQRIGHTGLPLFWRVRIERFGIDMRAAQRQTGLGLMLGAGLAQVMGPDEDMARPVMAPLLLTVCEACACTSELPVAAMAEVVKAGPTDSEGGTPE
jgi:hypothetical protein